MNITGFNFGNRRNSTLLSQSNSQNLSVKTMQSKRILQSSRNLLTWNKEKIMQEAPVPKSKFEAMKAFGRNSFVRLNTLEIGMNDCAESMVSISENNDEYSPALRLQQELAKVTVD